MDIRKKNKYEGLVKSEVKNGIYNFLKVFCLSMCIPIVIYLITFGLYFLRDNEIFFFISCGVVLFLALSAIFMRCRIVVEKYKHLDKVYQYLPLNYDDIQDNNLKTVYEYLVCLHDLVYCGSEKFHYRKIFSDECYRLYLSKCVERDLVEIMSEYYHIDKIMRNILKENLSKILYKCDSVESFEIELKSYVYMGTKGKVVSNS